jgi:hypothetical protein
MKALATLLSLYIFMMISLPLLSADRCDLHQEMEEACNDSEHAGYQCCPPFTFCKACSIFYDNTSKLTFPTKAILANPLFFGNYSTAYWRDVFMHVWHPPKNFNNLGP